MDVAACSARCGGISGLCRYALTASCIQSTEGALLKVAQALIGTLRRLCRGELIEPIFQFPVFGVS